MLRRALASLALLLAAAPALAQDAAEWLARMRQALVEVDYQGELVYVHGNQVEALRIFHAAGPDGGRERLASLNGAEREVVRADGEVTCIGIGDRPAVYGDASLTGRMMPSMGIKELANLQRYYAISLAGNERIAGHVAQVLQVQPRDAYRYGYRLWIERETGLPLKSTRFGADGRAVEQLMFTRVELGRRPDDADLRVAALEGASRTVLPAPRLRRSSAAAWRVIDPPQGFALAARQPASTPGVEHLLYSDGLANVSVYVETLQPGMAAFSGAANRGAINLFGRITGGRQVTVLGDVPAATVERFARGIAAAE